MEFINVIVAGIASFMFGAVWYWIFATPWMEASGVAVDPDSGKPANSSSPTPYITAIMASILVAGMMRHAFVTGFGIGAFLATPWLATNYGFAGQPFRLLLIDGGYATFGCTMIGIVLVLF